MNESAMQEKVAFTDEEMLKEFRKLSEREKEKILNFISSLIDEKTI